MKKYIISIFSASLAVLIFVLQFSFIGNAAGNLLSSSVGNNAIDKYLFLHMFEPTFMQVREKIGSGTTIHKADGTAVLNGFVGTGMKAELSDKSIKTLIVDYDLSGDGGVDAIDSCILVKCLLKVETPDINKIYAANCGESKSISLRNLLQLKKYLANNGTFSVVPYSTGLNGDLQYNNTLYGMNGSNDVEGADPGCFYVSKEEDANYGGYYYMYKSGSTFDSGSVIQQAYKTENDLLGLAYLCYRSKDMYSWQPFGAYVSGYSLRVQEKDWCRKNFWAPEVIRNPKDGKYYMYFSASSDQNWGVSSMSSSSNELDRLYLGVAVSDKPCGPFNIIYDTDASTGKRMPTINFHTGCSTQYDWPVIDASPFFDDNGDLYLYFNKSDDNHYHSVIGVWGMKMTSMTKPDYSTVSFLATPDRTTCSNTPGSIESGVKGSTVYGFFEGGINEAPFMIKHDGKYYLTYASNGCASVDYSVHQAISSLPLSGFVKLSAKKGNPVLNGDDLGYMNGTAHHAFVKCGNELWIIYHRHNSLKGMEAGWDRSICADRVAFVKNSDNVDALVANGPSKGLNWLPESVSGYKNIAKDAEITVSGGTGTAYLSDEIMPYYTLAKDKAFKVSSGNLTVNYSFKNPVSVSSVMIYNALNKSKAFSKVSSIVFTLSDGTKHVIRDLYFPDRYYKNGINKYISCAPAVADFEKMSVTKISIEILGEDRLDTSTQNLELSEIVILGKVNNSASEDFSCNSFCETEADNDININGEIDELCWMDKKWTKTEFEDNSKVYMQAKGFVTEKGLYLAAKSFDNNVVNDGDLTMESNTLFGFTIIPENETNTLYSTTAIIDMRGDCYSGTAIGFNRAVKVDGVLNSGNTNGAVMEAFFPWEALKIKPTDNKPSSFTINITYYAFFSGETYNKLTKTQSFVAGKANSNFVEGSSLFVKSVKTSNGKTVYSATDNWDVSRISENILVGSYANGCALKPMYFASKGNTWLISADVSYSTPSQTISAGGCQPDLLAGIILHNGSSSGWVGVRQHGIVYNENWIEHVIPYDVLTTWDSKHRKINLQILLDDGYLYFFVDGKFATELEASKVVNGFNKSVPVAVGLTMGADKKSEITYQNIGFSEDYSEISAFINSKNINAPLPEKSLFADYINVGNKYFESATDSWEVSDNCATGTFANGCALKPVYFSETGNEMLLNCTVKFTPYSVSSQRDNVPFAGIMLNDGRNTGTFGILQNNVRYNDEYIKSVIGYDALASWNSEHRTVQLKIALHNGLLYIYVDSIFITNLQLDTVLPNADENTQLAFALTMNATNNAEIEYSDIKFTCDKDKVEKGIRNSLFAKSVEIDGKILNSAMDVWDTSNIADNVVRAASAIGSKLKPIYFAQTGASMHLSTHVSATRDSEEHLGPGLWMGDGIGDIYVCIYDNKLIYKPYSGGGIYYYDKVLWSKEPISPDDGGPTDADLDFTFVNDTITITVNNSQSISIPANVFNMPTNNNWAYALTARNDGTRKFDITFSDISFEAQPKEKNYYVSYFANGALVDKVPFTLNNPTVTGKEPAVPSIPNTVGAWEPHITSGLTESMTVNAVYSVSVPSESTAITLNKYNGSEIDLNTDVVSEYLATDTQEQTAYVRNFCSQSSRTYQDHQNTSFTWTDSGSNSSYTVYFADNLKFDNAYIVSSKQPSLINKVGIFVPGKTYYWFVYGNNTGKCSAVDSFTVTDTRVRYITAGTVINMRDLGGLTTTDGDKVKYSLVYRGAALDETNSVINDEARGVFNYLGMNSEIELRGGHNHEFTGWDDNNSNVYYIGAVDYEPLFTINNSTKAAYKAAFEGLADESNYPFYFHCSVGADRTGTFAYLLYGLLGVSYEDIRADYELTSFSKVGLRPADVYVDYGSLDSMHNMMLRNYGGTSNNLKTAVENYLINFIGVDMSTIEAIRNIMLEKQI